MSGVFALLTFLLIACGTFWIATEIQQATERIIGYLDAINDKLEKLKK